jgi:hypothetical protein
VDSSVFMEQYGLLQAAFSPVSKEKARLDWTVLKDMNNEAFKMACANLIKTFIPTAANPFPVPAHFFNAIGEDVETQADHLMTKMFKAIQSTGSYRSVNFGNKALHSVIERWGGWPKICHMTEDEWKISEGRFKAVLISAMRYDEDGPEICAGLSDIHNNAIGRTDLLHIPASYAKKRSDQPERIGDMLKEAKGE